MKELRVKVDTDDPVVAEQVASVIRSLFDRIEIVSVEVVDELCRTSL